MADVAEHATYTDAATAISQGKRHLLVQDYTAAVAALAEGLEMMSQKLGDCDDALGEPYLLYGRALLGLAREEVGVLGEGVPGSEEAEDDDEDEDDEDNEEEDDKASETEARDDEQQETNEKSVAVLDEEKKNKEKKNEEKKDEEKKDEKKDEEKKVSVSKENKKEEETTASNKTDDKKLEEAKMEGASSKGAENVAPGPCKDAPKSVPEAGKSSNCNGTAGPSGATDDSDDVNKEEDEEDPGRGIDLQVAWEVLELAKIVFAKRGEPGLKHLAETHRLLGEVAMESDNHQGAITDLEGALELLEKIEPREPRALADIHYQLGLAHSMANDFDASIKQFAEATSLLEARIKELEETPESADKSDDPFYSIEGEIKELRELLPAIQEKIIDMKDFKEEACRLVIEGIKNKVAGGSCTNGSSASTDGASGSNEQTPATGSNTNAKPASDISHLVRKKRKHENDNDEQVLSPCKKPTP